MTAKEKVLVCLWASEPFRESFDYDFLGCQTDNR